MSPCANRIRSWFLAALGTVLLPLVLAAQAVYLGMSREQVSRALGEPNGIASVGGREVWQYPRNVQVIFQDGRIVDVRGMPYHYDREMYLEAHGGKDPLADSGGESAVAPGETPAAETATEAPGAADPGAATTGEAPVAETAPAAAPDPAEQVIADDPAETVAALEWSEQAAALFAEHERAQSGLGPEFGEPTAGERALATAVQMVVGLMLTWFVLFVSFKVIGLPTGAFGLVIVALIDIAVKGGGALLAHWWLGMDSLFGMERIAAVPAMLVSLMKFTSATSVPTAVKLTIITSLVAYGLGYLFFFLPITTMWLNS